MPAETGHTVSLMPRSVTRVGRNLQEVKNASGADSTADQNLYRCGRGIRTHGRLSRCCSPQATHR